MKLTALFVMILGTLFLVGGAIFFIKLAYDKAKKGRPK